MFTVYILKSINFVKYYIGQTEDISKRLAHHNSAHARWTKRFQPWEVVYAEEYATRSEAMIRESELKRKGNIRSLVQRLNATD